MKNLIIYGIGSFAEYVAYAFNNDSKYTVKAFCSEKELLQTKTFANLPLIDFDKIIKLYPPENHFIFIAIGNNYLREKFYIQANEMKYEFANYISSQCSKWENLKVGNNCFIDEGCILQPVVSIAYNCVLFAAEIGHHTKINQNTLVSGAITGGNVIIGAFCYVGLKSAIKQNLSIGNHAVIGMGCIIEKNVLDYEVYSHKGTKKRSITSDQLGNRFLKR